MDRYAYQPKYLQQADQYGFTLLEMMLVLLISAILSASGLYGWQRWQQQQHLTQTVQQTRQFFERLRDDANWHNRNHYLWLHQDQHHWCLGSSVSETVVSETAVSKSIKRKTIADSEKQCDATSAWQFQSPFDEVVVSDFSEHLAFYGIRSTAWAGHITLRSPAGEWRIIVSNWGRIRSCSLNGSGSC